MVLQWRVAWCHPQQPGGCRPLWLHLGAVTGKQKSTSGCIFIICLHKNLPHTWTRHWQTTDLSVSNFAWESQRYYFPESPCMVTFGATAERLHSSRDYNVGRLYIIFYASVTLSLQHSSSSATLWGKTAVQWAHGDETWLLKASKLYILIVIWNT